MSYQCLNPLTFLVEDAPPIDQEAVLLTSHVAGMQSETEDSHKPQLASFCEYSPADEEGS
jgi:hypothetical protein